MVKNPPAIQETWVRSLGWEGHLQEGMAPHSSILAGDSQGQRRLVGRGDRATVHGVAKSQARLSDFQFTSLLLRFGELLESLNLCLTESEKFSV